MMRCQVEPPFLRWRWAVILASLAIAAMIVLGAFAHRLDDARRDALRARKEVLDVRAAVTSALVRVHQLTVEVEKLRAACAINPR